MLLILWYMSLTWGVSTPRVSSHAVTPWIWGYKISFLLSSKFMCYSSLSRSSFYLSLVSLSPFLFWLGLAYLVKVYLFYFWQNIWVMKCCIMLNPKYSLNCCTCLILFEFELKTLDKINRKAIINSLENRKPNSAQVGPLSPAPRPRVLGAWQAGPACRRQPARPLSLSLSLPRWPGLSVPFLSPAHLSLSLSLSISSSFA